MTIDLSASALAAATGASGGGFLSLLAMYGVIFFIFYLIWWRPMQQRRKTLEQQIAELKKGDRVVTTGGFYGKVVKADEKIVVLEIADNTRVRVAKSAIGGLEGSPTETGST